jgi:quercetin dioxygenase-like cupin family protein
MPADMKSKIESYFISISPGVVLDRHFFIHKNEEFGLLISGVLELEMREKKYIMNEGDMIYLTSDVPRKWENASDKTAKILWILTK